MMGALQQAQMLATQGLPPYYGTGQANQAAAGNIALVGNKTREQLEYEENFRRQSEAARLQQQQGNDQFIAGLGNSVANANTSRGMAVNAQQALNNVYQQAGDRLNTAANNTMNAINNSAATVAGMFR